MRGPLKLLAVAAMVAPAWTAPASAAPYDVAEKDIATLQADMTAGRVTALDLVQAYEARIAQLDPMLHSVIALTPMPRARRARWTRNATPVMCEVRCTAFLSW